MRTATHPTSIPPGPARVDIYAARWAAGCSTVFHPEDGTLPEREGYRVCYDGIDLVSDDGTMLTHGGIPLEERPMIILGRLHLRPEEVTAILEPAGEALDMNAHPALVFTRGGHQHQLHSRALLVTLLRHLHGSADADPAAARVNNAARLTPVQEAALTIVNELPTGKRIRCKEMQRELKERGFVLAAETIRTKVMRPLTAQGLVASFQGAGWASLEAVAHGQ